MVIFREIRCDNCVSCGRILHISPPPDTFEFPGNKFNTIPGQDWFCSKLKQWIGWAKQEVWTDKDNNRSCQPAICPIKLEI